MNQEQLKEVFIEQLKDLYSAEKQLIKALPKLAKAATSDELRTAFEEHLEQTKGHAQRLETIFEDLDENTKGPVCKGMEGLIAEGNDVMGEDFEDEAMDIAVIAAAQRVEHYEIAGYGCVRTYAEHLSMDDAVSTLEQTLEEEKEADQKLSEISETLLENIEQTSEGSEEAEEQESRQRPRGRKARAARA